MIQDAFVNMENMLELMEEPIEVKDIPNALPLMALHGKIDFRNVSFHYAEDRQILKNLNFTVNPGQTFAIVSILWCKTRIIIAIYLLIACQHPFKFTSYDVFLGGSYWEWQNNCDAASFSILWRSRRSYLRW